jgi:hypothetical protein
MGSFSFTTEIKEERTLQLPAGTPTGRGIVAIGRDLPGCKAGPALLLPWIPGIPPV